MQLLEEYKELIERDAHEILRLWKYVQMFLYLLSAISGYVCSFLFYVLKEHIFGGNCPFWAKLSLTPKQDPRENCIHDSCTIISNWWRYIIIDYAYDILCEIYLITCFLSCLFGIVWFTLFLMCGKGGHDVSIYERPWRIVVPAMFFNFVFTIICMFAHYNLSEGYEAFSEGIINISSEIYNIYETVMDVSDCEVIKMYMNMNNYNVHSMCNIMLYLQVSSVIMVCSWISGLVILILRVLVVSDFTVLRIRIYEIKEE